MIPSEQDPHTLCTKCNLFVRTQNYLIHEARCRGPTAASQSRPPSRIFGGSRNNSSSLGSRISHTQPQQSQQRIACVFCGYPQTLKELDTHPNQCAHREEECRHCGARFPKSLMGQHLQFCPARTQPQRRQQPIFDNPRMPGSSFTEQFYTQGPMQVQQRRQQQNHPIFMIDDMMNQIMGFGQRRQPSPLRANFMNLGALIQLLAAREHGEQAHGMSKQQIKRFPVAKYKAAQKKPEEEQDICIVCYCAFEEGEDCMTLPCKHIFHPECVGTWLEKNPTCPVCKHSYGPPREEEPQHPPRGFIRVLRM